MRRIRLQSKFFNEVGETPLPQYPRPQLERDSFVNLNGKWQFSLLNKSAAFDDYDRTILVPFSPESLLSGLEEVVEAGPNDILRYKREFTLDEKFIKAKTFINFGAVDYLCTVKINGKAIGGHRGGYTPFALDATDAVKAGKNVIEVEVTDPADTGVGARAKQAVKHSGIWYTPQSGIWQTVWLESVPKEYVQGLTILPDIDKNVLTVKVDGVGKADAVVTALDGDKVLATATAVNGVATLKLTDYQLWSPESPKLYDLTVKFGADSVKSYFGMRKFSIVKDAAGYARLALNNKPYFHSGVLDQGYWSDGMLTPPTDSAMEYDIALIKSMGFNMIRKHIKIEPLRWYYHCDKLGMLVWQDIVSGGGKYNFMAIGALPFVGIHVKDTEKHYKFFARDNADGRAEYMKDMTDTVAYLKNAVGLAVWVPFNEGWGQFDSVAVTAEMRKLDNTRVIDSVSGWHDQGKGSSEMKSLHIYFKPLRIPKDDRVVVISEFGGYSLKTDGHVYSSDKSFGYRIYKTKEGLTEGFSTLFAKRVKPLLAKGLSAIVYTQVSDVEEEINGMITYDRKVVKIEPQVVKALNDDFKL